MSLNVCCPPILAPIVNGNWKEDPLSKGERIGHLACRAVTWLPINLAIAGLNIAILCLTPKESDGSLNALIGCSGAAVAFAAVNIFIERCTARQAVLCHRVIKENYSTLREGVFFQTQVTNRPLLKAAELKKQLCEPFSMEFNILFDEFHLVERLFQYWNDKDDVDLLEEWRESVINRFQFLIDRETVLQVSNGTPCIILWSNVMLKFSSLFMAVLILMEESIHYDLLSDKIALKNITWTYFALSLLFIGQWLGRTGIISLLENKRSGLLPPTRSMLQNVRGLDISNSLQRNRSEIKIEILE